MRTFAEKTKATHQTKSAKPTIFGRAHFGHNREVISILRLQRAVGNQALQRLLQNNADELVVDSTITASPRFAHDFSRISVHPKSPANVQAKLTVDPPGDHYEQQAERVADLLMSMPEHRVQRACDCGGSCSRCGSKQKDPKLDLLQTKASQTGGAKTSVAPQAVNNVLGSTGRPLDSSTRSFFEPRFGHDFSQVRIHMNKDAAKAAQAVNALAFTVGPNIVFGTGRHQPQTQAGRALLAHELTHVLQQRRANTEPRIQRWSYGSGTHGTGGGNTFDEVTVAERQDANGVDKSMRIINSLVTGTNWRARHCQEWFTDNATVARSLADVHGRAVIWMWRAAPSTTAGLTDGGNTAHHANAEWLFKRKDWWSLAGNMMHEYWHDCSTAADPDIGDDASAACGLPVV